MATGSEQPNYKDYQDKNDKPFFAAYLNSAKQNTYLALRDINESLGLGFDLGNDDNIANENDGIWKLIKDDTKPETTLRVVEKLKHTFPFLRTCAMKEAHISDKETEPSPKFYANVLLKMIRQLQVLRNYYTHAIHDPYRFNTRIIFYMRECFDQSRQLVQERFQLSSDKVAHLVRKDKHGEKKNYRYAFEDRNYGLTEIGLAFFTCLWLPRQQAQLFLKKLTGFKRSEEPHEKATLEAFTINSIRLPRPRLKSDKQQTGLINDILNELTRCPKELYPLLKAFDKKRFKTTYEHAEELEDDEYINTPVLKRYQNRFFYFAIRYLDPQWEHLKFHIDLGHYTFHTYDQVINGVTRIRQWQRHLTTFGHLSDFHEDQRPDNYKAITLTPAQRNDGEIYITNTVPHYHIVDQRVGLKKTSVSSWPELETHDPNLKNKTPKVAPDYWLSLYELPTIAFYQMLCNRIEGLEPPMKIVPIPIIRTIYIT